MSIVHIVQFGFKPNVPEDKIADICHQLVSLKDKCIHPTSQKPYIKSAIGGRNDSPEGMAGGVTHAFMMEFESDEDRKYYLENDPAHLGFVGGVKDLVATARVVDFKPGKF
ncbi:stress responsive a b barrel domain-containing protein [Diplodia corticola]|uniref:Stress responsive a b barrel domain-containing protein n=1 Tax=Diplodia corticola TaxID=236234 RepID=A0A1J9R4U1_9PEZI|nr:stress responsive a b barrel domain-containing protein [Diplodia corticola]OJD35616.1 stress responsive a b barrel domain-containing protein [Diplodia corticola]